MVMSEVCVRVAVRVRPLLRREVLHHHQVCVRVVPGSSQVMLGSERLFSFDHAFGPTARQEEVYESCVQPLVESLVDGYNATVFCYGQTGSGKTYTLGGGQPDDEEGIIGRVAQDLFLLLEEKRKRGGCEEATVRASYIELYKEELRDLLELHTIHKELHIREDEKGNTVVAGAKEVVISSAEELFSVLEMGNVVRHTAATGMNEHSSRSHAILTLQVSLSCHNDGSSLTSVRSSKLCLVDLAGSERAGKTGNTGTRLKESAHINTGLLALGNVIRALSEHGRNRRGNACGTSHIPYRDAKITRLLRDSLGGTAHTLMVACVSPSHHLVTETLSVLQFASKARHIRNLPGAAPAQTDVKASPATWHPGEARLGELQYELQTLVELLREKEREVELEKERLQEKDGEGEKVGKSTQLSASEPGEKENQEESSQFRLLAQQAAVLLADMACSSQSLSFKQRLQDWEKSLAAATDPHGADHEGYAEKNGHSHHHLTMFRLREELNRCQDALRREEQQVEQKDVELRQVQMNLGKLLQERNTLLKSSDEERERSRIQTEQLVNQQILIDRLRRELMAFRRKTSDASEDEKASGFSEWRCHSVPLIRHSCRPARKIHSSPPAYSLERVMAAFKMRGNLLLAEIEERDEMYCPFIKQPAKSKDGDQDGEQDEDEEDIFMSRAGFRHSLNRTWTSQQKNSSLRGKNNEQGQTCDGSQVIPRPHRATGTEGNQKQTRKARIRASVTERRIQDLSVNMRMKEELIKELDKTERETKAVDRQDLCGDAGQPGLLAQLSIQSQQVRAEMYHSLQHIRLQRAQLQTSLGQLGQASGISQKRHLDAEQTVRDVYHWSHLKIPKETPSDRSWLEEEEERALQKRAELQELEEDVRKREEVLQHREACLQQKSKLEIRMLQSSQALGRDLLHVSTQLESMEELLQRSREASEAGGVTVAELEEERNMLKEQRDTLDAQLRENRVLTVEEEHCILQLEEAIEALDAAVEFKNQVIRDKEKKLLVSESSLHQARSTEPVQLCDAVRKLRELSLPEAVDLLIKYFNKVICLREAERHLRLRCEELELHVGEQEAVTREMEAAMQRLTLDTDRRLTQQHRDHLNTIQLLLQKLKEGGSGEAQQAIQDRLQHLEKDLFFYKSSCRQLKKKLREVLGDVLHADSQPTQVQPLHTDANHPKAHDEKAQTTTHIAASYTKVHAEQSDGSSHTPKSRHTRHTLSLISPSARRETKMAGSNQTRSESLCGYVRGRPGESAEMTPVRLCRRELRQISAPDLQATSSASRRRQSVVDSSTQSIVADSIEAPRNM